MATKRELTEAEDQGWVELMGLVHSLGHGEIEEPGYFPEGWSVKDLLAHLASWCAEAARVLQWVRYGTYLRRQLDIDAMNREFYEANKDLPLSVVMAECWAARTRMLTEFNALEEVPVPHRAEEWFRESGPAHYEEHLPRLREWVAELGARRGGGGPSRGSGRASTTVLESGRTIRGMERRPSRLGVMGGTFDPIHHGHLVTAEEAASQFDLDEVVFVPTGQPWMKADRPVTPAEDRYLMVVIATAGNPRFSVSRIEIDREGPTYTVDTLEELRSQAEGEVELFFITGADAILEILRWKDPEEVLSRAHVIAATRPGYDLGRFEAEAPSAHPRISVMDIPALSISSTDIRRRVSEGRPIRYLVPEGVQTYIEKADLYR